MQLIFYGISTNCHFRNIWKTFWIKKHIIAVNVTIFFSRNSKFTSHLKMHSCYILILYGILKTYTGEKASHWYVYVISYWRENISMQPMWLSFFAIFNLYSILEHTLGRKNINAANILWHFQQIVIFKIFEKYYE